MAAEEDATLSAIQDLRSRIVDCVVGGKGLTVSTRDMDALQAVIDRARLLAEIGKFLGKWPTS